MAGFLVLFLCLLLCIRNISKAMLLHETLIFEWAKKNEYEVIDYIESKDDWGPFWKSSYQKVFKLELQNRAGKKRYGYALCGRCSLSAAEEILVVLKKEA